MPEPRASAFRVTAHPAIGGKSAGQTSTKWDWLHALSIEQWEDLINANLEEDRPADDTSFFVMKPGAEEVLDCPRDVALAAYQDVLQGKTTPSGSGPLATSKVRQLPTSGSRMRASVGLSYL